MLNRIDLSRSDLNLLVLFEAVMEEQHVGRTAERLHLTPSAVSHGLGRLRRLLNDPLFLRSPRGVVPTARALELAVPVADVLARARGVIAGALPFDPATSTRRFTIGAPDGVSAVLLPPLLAALGAEAPGIDISVRQLLPVAGEIAPDRAWRGAFANLDERAVDLAVIPLDEGPARFHMRALYDEDFVVALRRNHPFARDPGVVGFCAMQHLVVSQSGDPFGFVDAALAERGLARRIALTVPNFMLALAIIAETDLLAALPRRLVARHGPRFAVEGLDPPLPLSHFRLHAFVPKAALLDAGLEWLLATLARTEADPFAAAPATLSTVPNDTTKAGTRQHQLPSCRPS
jgi:DNA-binding transcriptional LysR family regulator